MSFKEIPFFDYKRIYSENSQDLNDIFENIGRRGAFIMQKATIINTLSIRREITLFWGRGKLTKNFKNTIHFPEASNHIAILLATILLQDEQPMHLINKDYM